MTDPTSKGQPMYELANVTKTYDQKGRQVRALTDVDLRIEDGEFLAIQGQTGGGKSTLLQLLGALDRPTSGVIAMGGDDLTRMSAAALTKVREQKVGFVFQNFNLIPTLTAVENVETAIAHVRSADRRSRARSALESVGLGDRLAHLPGELSGGQQQRVAIARALVKQPAVILADEPTGALDEDTRDEIIELLESVWTERGITLVVVTHDSWVAHRAERRIHLKQGRLTEQGGSRSKRAGSTPVADDPR